jgi:hypothetical protein
MGKVTWRGWKQPEEMASPGPSIVMGRNLRKGSVKDKQHLDDELSDEVNEEKDL